MINYIITIISIKNIYLQHLMLHPKPMIFVVDHLTKIELNLYLIFQKQFELMHLQSKTMNNILLFRRIMGINNCDFFGVCLL